MGVNIDVLRVDHKKLGDGLKRIEREIEKDEELGEDAFETSLGPFKDKATFQFEALDEKYKNMQSTYERVAKFLLEPKLKPEELFMHISKFIKMIENSAKKVSEKKARMEKMQKAKAAKEAKKRARAEKKAREAAYGY